MSLLITGATGFIGKGLMLELTDYTGDIFVLVREHSLKKAIQTFSEMKNVKFIIGDITNINILSDYRDLDILSQVQKVIHVGGGYDIEMKTEAAYVKNVIGTQNVISLSKKLPNLLEFHLVSSFSVVGTNKDYATAGDFAEATEILSPYAESKKIAEMMTRKVFKNSSIKLVIYRPGIVIPNFDGELEKIDGLYYFFKNILKAEKVLKYLPNQLITLYPFDEKAFLPLISLKSVASFISSKIKSKQEESLASYFIISEKNKSVRQYMEEALFLFNKSLILKPVPTALGKRMRFGFGLIPKELSDFAFFKTKLIDDKSLDEAKLIEKYNRINVRTMINQTQKFMGRL